MTHPTPMTHLTPMTHPTQTAIQKTDVIPAQAGIHFDLL
jgi:hypothetical protein